MNLQEKLLAFSQVCWLSVTLENNLVCGSADSWRSELPTTPSSGLVFSQMTRKLFKSCSCLKPCKSDSQSTTSTALKTNTTLSFHGFLAFWAHDRFLFLTFNNLHKCHVLRCWLLKASHSGAQKKGRSRWDRMKWLWTSDVTWGFTDGVYSSQLTDPPPHLPLLLLIAYTESEGSCGVSLHRQWKCIHINQFRITPHKPEWMQVLWVCLCLCVREVRIRQSEEESVKRQPCWGLWGGAVWLHV